MTLSVSLWAREWNHVLFNIQTYDYEMVMTAVCSALHSEHRSRSIHSLSEREREIHLYTETHHVTSAPSVLSVTQSPSWCIVGRSSAETSLGFCPSLSYAGGVRELREVSARPGFLHILTVHWNTSTAFITQQSHFIMHTANTGGQQGLTLTMSMRT